jgi:hypothetical protein
LISKFGDLPSSYVQFLKIAGRGAGRFLQGSDFAFPELLELRSWAEELLVEAGVEFRLRPEDFVFFMHQGYQFWFFRNAEGVPVFGFGEGEPMPRATFSSFPEWLQDAVELHIRLMGN